jgi:glycosyltransferase involved in cell wall biosynthesis
MDISIVVPFYNEEKYIEGCIKALLAQDYPADRYEIIMVNNNSADRSVEIVKRYPEVKLVSEKTPGDFAARNRGIKESKGDVIAFTDSDTTPFSDWLQNIMSTLGNPKVEMIIGSLHYPANSLFLSMVAAYKSERANFVFSNTNKEIYYGYTCNMVVRKKIFDTLGLIPSIYRNSDIVMLFEVLNKYSCEAVCYSANVGVRRLEVSNIWKYYSKHYIYGRDFYRYSKVANASP